MSLAETMPLDRLCWADLTAREKCDAVKRELVEGRNVRETAAQLALIYGPMGANQVAGVVDRHDLDQDAEVVAARVSRAALERAVRQSRVRALKPAAKLVDDSGSGAALPAVPLPNLEAGARRKGWLTLFELKDNSCRRPAWGPEVMSLSDKLFCGRTTDPGKSYCTKCAADLYRPAEAPPRMHVRGQAGGKA